MLLELSTYPKAHLIIMLLKNAGDKEEILLLSGIKILS